MTAAARRALPACFPSTRRTSRTSGRSGGLRRGARALVPLALLLSAPTLAHEPDFTFLEPQGIGLVREGGTVELRWQGSDSQGLRQLELYASRGPVTGWRQPQPEGDVHITPAPLPLATTPPHYTWDTTGLPPGCYQPYAVIREATETWPFVVPGKVTVRTATFVPPAVWLTNARGEEPDAYGRFVIRYQVHDPDSATTVSLKYGDGLTLHPIAEGLPVPQGGGEGSFVFDVSGLEQGYYELYAQVEAPGEPSCEAFWVDVLYVPGGPYAQPNGDAGGPDGGPGTPDAGDGGAQPPDSGEPTTPGGPGGEPEPPGPERPKGCSASPGAWLTPALLLLLVQGRRRRGRSGEGTGTPSRTAPPG